MARGSVTISGMEGITADLDNFMNNLSDTASKTLRESLVIIERAVSANVNTLFTKGYSEGVLMESVSHNVSNTKNGASGSVGVYDMSNKTQSSDRRITAPLLGYFYEFGIKPHSLARGSKTERRPTKSSPRGRVAKGQDEPPMHPGSSPIPFLTNAFINHNDEITNVAIRNYNELV